VCIALETPSEMSLMYSTNLTVKGSKGLVGTSDQAYTSLPADSRKPAGPIDPSGMSTHPVCVKYS
jgi:hypothetical protein